MHDVGGVHVAQPLQQLEQEGLHVRRGQRLRVVAGKLGQVRVHVLKHHVELVERLPVAGRQDVFDLDHVGVVQLAQDANLPQDALGVAAVVEDAGDLLDGNMLTRPYVHRVAHGAVGAGAHVMQQLVARAHRPRGKLQGVLGVPVRGQVRGVQGRVGQVRHEGRALSCRGRGRSSGGSAGSVCACCEGGHAHDRSRRPCARPRPHPRPHACRSHVWLLCNGVAIVRSWYSACATTGRGSRRGSAAMGCVARESACGGRKGG